MKPLHLLAILTFLPCVTLAQSSTQPTDTSPAPDGPEHHRWFPRGPLDPKEELERLTKALQLTYSQQDQIKPILKAEFAKMKSIHDDTSLSEEQKLQQMEGLRKDTDNQIEDVLTPEQITQFEKMHQEGAMHDPHGQPDPKEAFEHLSQALKLTDSQKEQIKPILKAEFEKMKSIHDDTSLTEDQRHQQMEAAHQDAVKQIEAVLTPVQVAQFEGMQHHRGEKS